MNRVSTSMTDRLVSIVLPTYNGTRYVEQAIDSCLGQTYSNWELIIVDDASTDDTPAKIARYVQMDRRIRSVCHTENRKLPAALNTGFTHAKGDYLTWTSDDNYYRPEALAEMVTFLRDHTDVGVVYTDWSIVDEADAFVERVKVLEPQTLLNGNYIGPCFLYRRQVQDAVGAYSGDLFLAEDYDFWLRASIHYRLRPHHKDLYHYRARKNSLSTLYTQRVERMADRALSRHLPKIEWASDSAKAAAFLYLAQKARQRHEFITALRNLLLVGRHSPRVLAHYLWQTPRRRLRKRAAAMTFSDDRSPR